MIPKIQTLGMWILSQILPCGKRRRAESAAKTRVRRRIETAKAPETASVPGLAPKRLGIANPFATNRKI